MAYARTARHLAEGERRDAVLLDQGEAGGENLLAEIRHGGKVPCRLDIVKSRDSLGAT
jgi:hypothetical protein